MRLRTVVSLATLGLAALLTPAFGDTLASNFSNTTGSNLANPPFTLGWQFTVASAIDVTWLDLFDDSQDGLADSHAIGIWDSTGTLLVSSTIDAGVVDPLHDKFRAVSVAPTLLGPGTYQIGALFVDGNDPNIFPGGATSFVTASGITFDQSAFAAGGALANPTSTAGTDPAYFGPNFEFTAAAVPEPGSILLLATAVFLTGMAFRRRYGIHTK